MMKRGLSPGVTTRITVTGTKTKSLDQFNILLTTRGPEASAWLDKHRSPKLDRPRPAYKRAR